MTNTNQTLILAASILLGFGLIAGAIFFSGTGIPSTAAVPGLVQTESPKRENSDLRRVYGNPEAEVTIVEFSDYECPFCSRLHPTLKRVVDESEGAVNWEYRHLPLSIHATAEPAAIAAECVGDLAGNDVFWTYSAVLLANQQGMTASFLETTAVELGVTAQEFQSCINSPEIAGRVQDDVQSALALGGSGTPFNVVEFADGTTKVASGALPYESWAQVLGSN